MKKHLLSLLISSVVLSLSACSLNARHPSCGSKEKSCGSCNHEKKEGCSEDSSEKACGDKSDCGCKGDK